MTVIGTVDSAKQLTVCVKCGTVSGAKLGKPCPECGAVFGLIPAK